MRDQMLSYLHCITNINAFALVEGAAKGAIESSQTSKLCKLLLIHGGMDTLGEIFDDCLVYRLE